MSAYRVPRNTIESTLIKRGGGKNGGEKIPIGQYRPLELGEFSSKFKLPSKENVVIAETTGRREIPRREGGGRGSDIWDRVGNSRWTPRTVSP